MSQYQVSHVSVPGAVEAAEAGIPPVLYQPRNPYASAAYVTDGNGVSPLVGYPSQYPHVIHYTPRPVPASIYAPIPTMADVMGMIQAMGPTGPVISNISSAPRRSAPPSNQNNQSNQSKQADPPAKQSNQQTSPGVYNGRVRVGDDLRLSDVSQGGVPPVPPTPAAPAAPAPSPMEDPMGLLSLNEWLSSGYAGAPDLVGSPDPEVVQDPATVAPAPDVSQRTSVSLPSSPVASQAEFMTQAEAAPLAQDNAVNTQSLSDASGIVQDMVRAYMAPYYNLYHQGAALGRAIGRELRNPTVPQAGVTPIPGVAAPAVIVP